MRENQRRSIVTVVSLLHHTADVLNTVILIHTAYEGLHQKYDGRVMCAGGEGTSIVERVFGGLLRSDVTCCSCNYTSTAYDPFLDISLDMCALPPVPAPPGAPPRSHFFGAGPKGTASKATAAGDKKRRNGLISPGVISLRKSTHFYR